MVHDALTQNNRFPPPILCYRHQKGLFLTSVFLKVEVCRRFGPLP